MVCQFTGSLSKQTARRQQGDSKETARRHGSGRGEVGIASSVFAFFRVFVFFMSSTYTPPQINISTNKLIRTTIHCIKGSTTKSPFQMY